jgi:hypothetical protein
VKGYSSPTISSWLNKFNNHQLREKIHLVFLSKIYGIVPIELNAIFPLGQFEMADPNNINDAFYRHSLSLSINFIEKTLNHYIKGSILVPEYYQNQFGEQMEFLDIHPITRLYDLLKKSFKIKFSVFKDVDDILQYLEAL